MMTPEERQRTMDFILQQQAQFSADIQREREERLADMEREREERLADTKRENEERLADMKREREERLAYRPRIARVEECVIVLTELAQIQSRRLDWCDQQLNETRNLHKDSITRLDRILSRLTEKG